MYPQYHQMTLEAYEFPFGKLDSENEWVKLAALVPWDVAEVRLPSVPSSSSNS